MSWMRVTGILQENLCQQAEKGIDSVTTCASVALNMVYSAPTTGEAEEMLEKFYQVWEEILFENRVSKTLSK